MAHDSESLVQSAKRLASLPKVYQRINAAVDDPACSLDDLARIIHEDPALAALLLKIANSALFALPTPATTITRALTVIGTRQLRDLVMATAVMSQFDGVSGKHIQMDSFWRHSIACGLAARVIATFRREANVESFYVTGLLHDIGVLVIYMELPKKADEILERTDREKALVHEVEREVLGFDHAQVGGALLARWKLPASMHQAVSNHHNPSRAKEADLEAAVVHVADIISMSMNMGSSGGIYVPPLSPGAWEKIGLPSSQLPAIVEQVERQYDDVVKVFLQEG